MQKILVTGSNGLVGNAIKDVSKTHCEYNQYQFIFLTRKDCDLTDYKSTFNCIQKYKPDYVINLAANVGGLFKNIRQKVQMFEDNMLMNINILKSCKENNVNNIINVLSTCIFPDKIKYPINEEDIHKGEPHTSNEGYAYAKRMVDILSKAYKEQYNLNVINIIPTNIYGENDNFDLEDSHVIPALIHKFYNAKKNNSKVIIKGTGKPLRQFIYSKDLAKVMLELIKNNIILDRIIVAPNESDEISIKKLVDIISKHFDYYNYEFENSEDGQYKKTASNSLLQKNLDIKFIDINIGIQNTIEWFQNNFESCRK